MADGFYGVPPGALLNHHALHAGQLAVNKQAEQVNAGAMAGGGPVERVCPDRPVAQVLALHGAAQCIGQHQLGGPGAGQAEANLGPVGYRVREQAEASGNGRIAGAGSHSNGLVTGRLNVTLL